MPEPEDVPCSSSQRRTERRDSDWADTRGGQLPPFAHPQLVIRGDGSLVVHGPYTIQKQLTYPEAFVYSTTDEFSTRVMARFGGACVQIVAPLAFYEALHRAILAFDGAGVRRARGGWLGPCSYRSREHHYQVPLATRPAFMKPERHRDQREWRGVWPTPLVGEHFCDVRAPELTPLSTGSTKLREYELPRDRRGDLLNHLAPAG